MTAKEAIKMLRTIKRTVCLGNRKFHDALDVAISALGKDTNVPSNDCISRQDAIDEITEYGSGDTIYMSVAELKRRIEHLPSAQPEPLTDKEQRIFLAAMGREEKVCEEVDRNYVREPYEDSLIRVCKEIRRKVKGALWT